MNTQQAYEKMRSYFAQQGAVLAKAPSQTTVDGALCMYRTPEGNKCAVGCLIPDDLYSSALERMGIVQWQELLAGATADREFFRSEVSTVAATASVLGFLHDVDKEFLGRAQKLHDSLASDVKSFVIMLDLLAEASGLRPIVRQGEYF